MWGTDVEITSADVAFRDVVLDHPLQLSGGAVDRFTVVTVTVTAQGSSGGPVIGTGASVLSVPWAWPRSDAGWAERDAALREATATLAAGVVGRGPADPAQLYGELAAIPAPPGMPPLAVALARGGVDNAVHDAWARAAGRSAWGMYPFPTPLPAPRRRLPVQHVVGVGDPLTWADGSDRPLVDWIATDGVAHLKVKLAGRDPDVDARRVAAVHAVLGRGSISLDPNEGYAEAAGVAAMLDALERDAPAAYAALTYIEQPLPRDAPPDPDGLRAVGKRVPVLIDEGLAEPADLPELAERGWTGLVIKATRGQTLAIASHIYAGAAGMPVAVQDLTAVDMALAHSARLAATLPLTWPVFEYNSRQYAPAANAELAARRPALVAVRAGEVALHPPEPGIY